MVVEGALTSWCRRRKVGDTNDDDWQHPRKLSQLVRALGDDGVLAGCTRIWFLQLETRRVRAHHNPRWVLFIEAGFRRHAVADRRFDPTRRKASDIPWMCEVGKRAAPNSTRKIAQPTFF